MFLNQIRKGEIFYGIQVISETDSPHIPTLEIYEFQSCSYNHIHYNVVLGDFGEIRFPKDFNLNQIFYGYYHPESVWAYSFNESLMIDLFKRLVTGEIIKITDVYSIWQDKWIKVSLFSNANDNEGEL